MIYESKTEVHFNVEIGLCCESIKTPNDFGIRLAINIGCFHFCVTSTQVSVSVDAIKVFRSDMLIAFFT